MRNWSLVQFRLLVLLVCNLSIYFVTNPAAAADRTRPTTPTNLRATAITSTSVSLAWNPSTDNSGSFVYIVKELNSGQTRTVAQTQTTFTWTGLQPNKTYRFVVFARDGSGNQSFNSNTLTVKTPASPPPATPANLRVTAEGLNSISVAWNPVSGATGYQIQRVGSAIWSTGLGTNHTSAGLNPGTSYSFMVRAQGPGGFSPWSAPVTGTTLTDSTPPSTPTISGTALSPGVMRLTWTESLDDLSWVNYNVYVNGQPARSMLPDNSAVRAVLIYNLRAATTYEFTIKAYDTSGNFSTASQPLIFTMPTGNDTTPPQAPTNLRVMPSWGNGISSVGLGWNWSPDNVVTMAYEIYMDDVLVDEVLYDVHYPGVNNFIIVRGVPPGSTHTFTIKARDEAGNVSAASNPLTVAFNLSADTTPPSTPTLISGDTSPSCGFIFLNWSSSSDDTDAPNQLEYEIYEDGLFRGVWRDEAFEASFGRHRFHIRAVDRAGNRSAPSNEIVLDSGLDC